MVKHTTSEQRADKKAAEQLILACEHFGIDQKKVAKIIAILKEK